MAKILKMKNITKEFPGVKALDNVNFEVEEGEIHCLVGENGAGKSTLMKVLSGVYPYGNYSGDIIFNDKVQKFRNIKDSEKIKIAIIYQEFALFPQLSIYENIFIGHEFHKNNFIDWNKTIHKTEEFLKMVHLDVHPQTKVVDIGVGKQQLVEIAKALSKDVKLLILDEPTAALNENESENLMDLLRELKKRGVTSILISHKLKEVIDVADKVTILRDGQTITTLNKEDNTIKYNAMVKHMVGREITDVFPKREKITRGDIALEVKDLNAFSPRLDRFLVKDANFKVHQGEVVGIAGLMGAGRTELALSVFGNPLNYDVKGKVLKDNQPLRFDRPKKLIDAGVAYVSEDRKGKGLILKQNVKNNITLANLRSISRNYFINRNKEILGAEAYRKNLNIRTPSIEQKVLNLSGGNQQKVSLSKWLFVNPNVLILDEPTRGIDVGAKYEIYTIINDLVAKGLAIVLISSELPEILGMADRIYVMNKGTIQGELSAKEANQEKIMELATA